MHAVELVERFFHILRIVATGEFAVS
jgi:hypothetical protein